MTSKQAIAHINANGILLVYPLDNRPEPLSLWKCFYPRSEMRWEWDDSGDNRVADLWHLRAELSKSGKVIYAKWFRGRATFFSEEVFVSLLALMGTPRAQRPSSEARGLLEILESDSPLSTKALRQSSGLVGKGLESTYHKALKQLWERNWIIGFGEVDDGAFPSLAVGATRSLREDLWERALAMTPEEAQATWSRYAPSTSLWEKFRSRLSRTTAPSPHP